MKATGVYKIENLTNGRCYVGSGVVIQRRFSDHRRRLRQGRHYNQKLQRAWDRDGEKNFAFSVVTICRRQELELYEQAAIQAFAAYYERGGYNTCPFAYSKKGVPVSERCKQVNRDRTKGKPNPVLSALLHEPARKLKSSQTLKAIRADAEIQVRRLANLRASHKDPEIAARIRNAQQTGRRAVRVVLRGQEVCLREAGRLLNRRCGLICWRMKKHGISHQEAVDYYASLAPGNALSALVGGAGGMPP